MATRINPVRVNQTGVDASAVTVPDLVEGNVVSNLAGLQVEVDNTTGASAVTVTFKTSATVEGQAVADITATVPVAGTRTFGRFSRTLFGDSVEFLCSADCDVRASY